MKPRLILLCLLLQMLTGVPCRADTQNFNFNPPALASDAGVDALMRDLAVRILPVYEEPDRLRYLANLSELQMVSGDYKAASASRQSLQNLRRSKKDAAPGKQHPLLDLYAQAKAMQANDNIPFAQAFSKLFRNAIQKLSDRDAYALIRWHGTPPDSFEYALQQAFDRLRGQPSINMPQALQLIQAYLPYAIHRQVSSLIVELGREDDQRRYVTEDDVAIRTSAGVVLHARVVRPKSTTKTLPALLEFSIVQSRNDAIACAAHGYVGVTAYTRGTSRSRGRVVPFEHDGEDARAVIKWITRQPWSDGRVGMYGDGYSGFAAWAAARHLPSALKAIATSDAMAPGIDFPVQGRIYQNSAFRWATTHTHGADQTSDDSDAYWRALNQQWYRSGKRYRDLDRMAKKPNRVFRRWLNHPSYDRYWQKMIPFRRQFAAIDIPVLSMTGYYANGEAGSLYYYSQLQRYRPAADHILLIGPYDDHGLRSQPSAVLRGYRVDSAARIDLQELRFQWFDHVLKGGAMPSLLKNRVNYEVMGANQWRHASSLEAMSNDTLKFYLDGTDSSVQQRLAKTRPATTTKLTQTVNFADRSDADGLPQMDILSKHLAVRHSTVFVSDSLKQSVEISGRLTGLLDFSVNKLDMDLRIGLYEQLPNGDYIALSDPYEFRASYARDPVHRHLLKAGERQQLTFTSTRLTSHRLQAGSRIVLVLGINKRPDQEINYGSGKDVSAASIADARTPLKVRWYGSSRIELPVMSKTAAVIHKQAKPTVAKAPAAPGSAPARKKSQHKPAPAASR